MSLGRSITVNDIGKSFKTSNGQVVEVKGKIWSPFSDEHSPYNTVECIDEEETVPETSETDLEEASVQKLTLTIPAGTSRLEGEFEGYRVTLEKL